MYANDAEDRDADTKLKAMRDKYCGPDSEANLAVGGRKRGNLKVIDEQPDSRVFEQEVLAMSSREEQLTNVLARLVELQVYKQRNGKTAWYEKERTLAWADAAALVGGQ